MTSRIGPSSLPPRTKVAGDATGAPELPGAVGREALIQRNSNAIANPPEASAPGLEMPFPSLPARASAAPPMPPLPTAEFTLTHGEVDELAARHGFSREEVEALLQALGIDIATGVEPAIRDFQSALGMPATGVLDLETLMALFSAALARDRRSASAGASGSHSSPHGGPHSGQGGLSDARATPAQTQPVDVANWKPGSGDVTPAQLKTIVPGLSDQKAAEVAPHLNRAMAEAGIDSPARKSAFIAQLAHESGGFKYNEEIASGRAYEGRRDLGNTQPGDGERFKGRGYIQLTGRANYAAAGKALGLDLIKNPELASRPENAARVAAWYWNTRGLNGLADKGNFDGITKRINGGYNGKADRDQYHARALQVLKDNVGLPSTGKFVGGQVDPKSPHKQIQVPAIRQRTATDCDDTSERMMKAVGVTPGNSDAYVNYWKAGEADLRDKGINYMMAQLKAGRPVMIGVDYKAGGGGGRDAQRGTDHFLVATGFGVDEKGRQFISFNDPADGSPASKLSNRLYRDPGTGNWRQASDIRQPYTLSAVVNQLQDGVFRK